MSAKPKKSFTHVVRERYCKGCSICVAFCPKHVLALSGGKVRVERPADCIGCRLCELRCPDYAIEVYESGAESAGAEAGDVDYCLPPEAINE
jgi:2-oxoglutarate ferredoxin oxidoreductase subunit delta